MSKLSNLTNRLALITIRRNINSLVSTTLTNNDFVLLKNRKRLIFDPQMTSLVCTRFQHSVTELEEDDKPKTSEENKNKFSLTKYRFIYPEFVPDPNVEFRNLIREKLERYDMIARRVVIDIPEFYVGSILKITISDPHCVSKVSSFTGICILREGCGLRANIILRNVIDKQGIEVHYDLYDPTIQKVVVLRLEKRLDDNLQYLRDALPEYYTFDPNMEQELLPDSEPIPINKTKVRLKPRPWTQKWERMGFKGLLIEKHELSDWHLATINNNKKPWEKYDLMKQYRDTIPEEEQIEIFSEIENRLNQLETTRKKLKRKRSFTKPVKTG